MPQYFFDTQDGDNDTDERGVTLQSDNDAVREAVRFAGSMISDQPALMTSQQEFVVSVRSQEQVIARVRIVLEQLQPDGQR